MSKIFNLILLGDPTAGKATQAEHILKQYPFLREFDLGAWIRALKAKHAKKLRVHETSAKGILLPTNFAREKFKEIIFTTPKNKGVFFNGNPKMLGEAKLVRTWFKQAGRTNPLVIYLSIPKKEVMKRIDIRGRVEKRSDDELQHLRNRMKYYAKDIVATLKFFKQTYGVKKVSGLGTRSEVKRRLLEVIAKATSIKS